MSASNDLHGIGNKRLFALALGAVGVVYGDIGTSPLYTLKETFGEHGGVPLTPDNGLGVLSLVFWALVLIVSFKYDGFIMRADNKGEGGNMSLISLAPRSVRSSARARYWIMILGLFGASLFFGDSVITPAVSVLSAVEGLDVAAPALERFIVPVVVVILLVLFSIQSRGTEKVGRVVGPVKLLWIVANATFGVKEILQAPQVLAALSLSYAVNFFISNGKVAFFALGSVVLAITGAEALYADMGHFGKSPLRRAWFAFVLPALMLNYLGQGVLLLC